MNFLFHGIKKYLATVHRVITSVLAQHPCLHLCRSRRIFDNFQRLVEMSALWRGLMNV